MGYLIDREALLKDLKEYMVNPEDVISEHPDDVHNYNAGLLTAIQLVTDAPVVQPEQLRLKCPRCGKQLGIYVKEMEEKDD